MRDKSNFLVTISFLTTLIFFSGCSSVVQIEANSCMEEARWSDGDEQETSFTVTRQFQSVDLDMSPTYHLPLSEMLWIRGLKCGQLKSLYLTIETRFIDSIVNLAPFITSRVVTVTGTTSLLRGKKRSVGIQEIPSLD